MLENYNILRGSFASDSKQSFNSQIFDFDCTLLVMPLNHLKSVKVLLIGSGC